MDNTKTINETNETPEVSSSTDSTTKEILIKGVVIPAMAVIVTQVVPYAVKKIAARAQARRAAKAAEQPNETTD